MIRKLVDFALENRFLVLAAARPPVWLGRHLVSSASRRSVSRRGRQLRRDHHPVAGHLRGANRAAGHHSAGNRDERHPARGSPALLFAVRALRPEADFRRRRGERLEPREGTRAAFAGHLAAGVSPQMGTDWSPVGQIYFFTLHSTQSAVRRDGFEVARRLGGREKFQVRAQYRRRGQLRRPHARVSGSRRSQQADLLRTQHRPGGAAAHQQQRQCRRQLHRSRPAADQRPRSGPGPEPSTISKTPSSPPRTARRCASRISPSWRRARRSGWASSPARFIAKTAKSSTTTTWSRASCSCAKARMRTTRSRESTPR